MPRDYPTPAGPGKSDRDRLEELLAEDGEEERHLDALLERDAPALDDLLEYFDEDD